MASFDCDVLVKTSLADRADFIDVSEQNLGFEAPVWHPSSSPTAQVLVRPRQSFTSRIASRCCRKCRTPTPDVASIILYGVDSFLVKI